MTLLSTLLDELGVEFAPEDSDDPDISVGTNVELDGISFTLVESGPDHPDELRIYCEFGPLPDDLALAATKRLFELNLLFHTSGGPVFGLNPRTGCVVCASRLASKTLSAIELAATLRDAAMKATLWRKGYFLDTPPGAQSAAHANN